MKVLSITEPYATLIANGVKKIETRSWKTNYRGKIYIHASSTKIHRNTLNNSELMSLVDLNCLNYGFIICSCTLKDCVSIDDDFINSVKKNKNEFVSGFYSNGRYAWILDDIKVLDKPIKAKGHLGIWNYER